MCTLDGLGLGRVHLALLNTTGLPSRDWAGLHQGPFPGPPPPRGELASSSEWDGRLTKGRQMGPGRGPPARSRFRGAHSVPHIFQICSTMPGSYGRLLIVGKEGAPEVEFPLDKRTVLIGRCVRSTGSHFQATHCSHALFLITPSSDLCAWPVQGPVVRHLDSKSDHLPQARRGVRRRCRLGARTLIWSACDVHGNRTKHGVRGVYEAKTLSRGPSPRPHRCSSTALARTPSP